MNTRRLILLLGIVSLAAGCMVKDTRHTLYLEPDGAVTWTILETDVHWAGAAEEQSAAEEAYVVDFYCAEHMAWQALDLLEPQDLESRLLRDRPPFAGWFSARYGAVDVLLRRLLELARVPGDVHRWADAAGSHLAVELWPDQAGDVDEDTEQRLLALVDDLEDYRLVLTAGRFTAAEGFRLEENGRVARPMEPDEAQVAAAGGLVRLQLTWQNE
ncbi:MAG: hypothetical protein JXQ27_18750 [Acidobacteria bacterium]|nr:hypothetical protein [Acidobacteriota bacterium]